jgi:hypothetical protein
MHPHKTGYRCLWGSVRHWLCPLADKPLAGSCCCSTPAAWSNMPPQPPRSPHCGRAAYAGSLRIWHMRSEAPYCRHLRHSTVYSATLYIPSQDSAQLGMRYGAQNRPQGPATACGCSGAAHSEQNTAACGDTASLQCCTKGQTPEGPKGLALPTAHHHLDTGLPLAAPQTHHHPHGWTRGPK